MFAVRANYMTQFRAYLEKEGIETEGEVELPLGIRRNEDFLSKGLVVPRVPEDGTSSMKSASCWSPIRKPGLA